MLAKELYAYLDNDFIKPEISDDWFSYMPELERFLCESFKKCSMGLVTDTIHNVYTAVFPSENVLHTILNNAEEAMLFLHHASVWDLKRNPHGFGFYNSASFSCIQVCSW